MGNVNCCETPKECLGGKYEEHFETNEQFEYNDNNNDNNNNNTPDDYYILKPKSQLDKKSLEIIKIQSTFKGFLKRKKFNAYIEKLRLSLKEYFKVNNILTEVDNINYFLSNKIIEIENNIKSRRGIFSNPNLPSNIYQDFHYSPILPIKMPCCFLVEKDKSSLHSRKSSEQPINGNDKRKDISRCVYQGYWSLDKKKYGYGILINNDGSKFEGMFRNGKLEGQGRYITINGDYFEGLFTQGSANGHSF